MNDDLNEIKVELASFKATVTEWMSTTKEYRINLCNKIDVLGNKLECLPCKERSGIFKSLSNQVKIIWGVLVIMIGAVFADWVKKR